MKTKIIQKFSPEQLQDIDQLLNIALNDALITNKIKGVVDSNKIAVFVSEFLKIDYCRKCGIKLHTSGQCVNQLCSGCNSNNSK